MRNFLKILFFVLPLSISAQMARTTIPAITPLKNIADNVAFTVDNWMVFNGYSNFLQYNDVLDATFAANDTYFEVEFKLRNYNLTDNGNLFTKSSITSNQRSWKIQKLGNDLNFTWFSTGASTTIRQVTFADCLINTNEHTILFKYDGSIDTNDGRDRVTLNIDGVNITSGKTLSATAGTLGQIFNSTAKLGFGQDVDATAQLFPSATWYKGEAKNLVIRNASTVIFHGLDVTPVTPIQFGTWTWHMQPILTVSRTSSAYDDGLIHMEAAVDNGTDWYLYYLGAGSGAHLKDKVFLATKTKSNDVTTGWTKYLNAGVPQVIMENGAPGTWDENQLWFRHVEFSGGTYKAWYIGENNTPVYGLGYATSTDGITWTKDAGNPIYTDANGITMLSMIKDPDDGKYKMIYQSNDLGANMRMAESSNGITGWTLLHSNILYGEGLGWPVRFEKINGVNYIWAAKRFLFFSGICYDVVLYTTTDFVNFTYYGTQLTTKGATELGLTGSSTLLKKPNGNYFWIHSSYKNQISVNANLGEEFVGVNVAELNRGDLPISGRIPNVSYPAIVKRHWPLDIDQNSGLNFIETITKENATINSTPVFTQDATYGNRTLGFVNLSGSQTITDTHNPGNLFNPAAFGVKLRVEIKTTGTHTLFKIGNDVWVTLESGKLRVRLSSDGVTYQKDYITTANISKPTPLPYVDNHIYVGFTWIGGVLTLFKNDVAAYNDPAEITKTVNSALTNVNTSSSNFIIGQNATLKMRSVSLLSDLSSNTEWLDLEI